MECCCCNLFLVLATVLGVIYAYFKWSFTYWEKRGIPGPKPSFPFGNGKKMALSQQGFFELTAELYKEYKNKSQHVGIYLFTKPIYIVTDLELVKSILIKDHHHFVDRGVFVNEEDDPLSAHLFSLEGNKWKILRAKLSPTFTSGKMKMMFSTLVQVGMEMEKALVKLIENKEPLDVKEILARYSTDVIGSCAFGLDCNSFTNPDSEFRKYGKKVFQLSVWDNIKALIAFMNPALGRKLHVTFNGPDVTNFFMKIVKDTVKFREEHHIDRNDFMKLLLELKNDNSDLGGLTIEEMAAQAFVFFVAGFETSSTTMTFCLFELSRNPDIQEKVREEINSVLKRFEGKITYEAIKEMKYLAMVVDETLRLYPPIPMLNRKCTIPYEIPDTNEILEKDVDVGIPTYGIHRDEDIYPDPDKFDPERFSEEMKAGRNPYAFLPFGEGPRNCIGLRFGLMQTKVGLSVILKNFNITLNSQTKLPLTLDPLSFTLNTLKKIYLDLKKI